MIRKFIHSIINITRYAVAAALFSVSVAAVADTVEVEIFKKEYIPQEITINKGDTVRWVNKERRQYHSVWFKELGEKDGEYFWPEETFERTFNEAGTFPYECGPHPKMTGVIHVRDGDK